VRYAIRPILATVLFGLLAPTALAQAPVVDSGNLSARLQRIEQTLSSSSLLQLAQNIQALQREIRELRGEMELQSRDISRLRKRQRDLYLDIDKRLQAMAKATAPAVAAAGANTTPAVNNPPGGTIPPAPQPGTATAATVTPPSAAVVGTPAANNQAPINANAVPVTPAPASATTNTAAASATQPATTAPPVTADPANEQKAYRQAFDLLKAGKFDVAANALQGFLKDYPNGRFADNAQYWLGEAYYVSRKFVSCSDRI